MGDQAEIGRWGEQIVWELLKRTFGATLSRQQPDNGIDIFCTIRQTDRKLSNVDWKIQVKTSTGGKAHNHQRNVSGRTGVVPFELTGDRINDCLDAKDYWLIFCVAFSKPEHELRDMDHRRSDDATVYVADMKKAINKREQTRPLPRPLNETHRYSFNISDANIATLGLLTFLWASHCRLAVEQIANSAILKLPVPTLISRYDAWGKDILSDIDGHGRSRATIAVATYLFDQYNTYQLREVPAADGSPIVCTVSTDCIEDLLAMLFDTKCQSTSIYRALSKIRAVVWAIQVVTDEQRVPLCERILVLHVIKKFLSVNFDVDLAICDGIRIVPEVSVPGFGATVSGFYETGHEFECDVDTSSQALNRRESYLHEGSHLRLLSPTSAFDRNVLRVLGFRDDIKPHELALYRCPDDLIEAHHVDVARTLAATIIVAP